MKKIIFILLLCFNYSFSQAVDIYKLTNLRVKPINCEWTQVLKPCTECDSIIVAYLDFNKKEIIIDTPTKQIYHYNKFNIKKSDIFDLSYSEAFDKKGNKVLIYIYLYNNRPSFFHVVYGDGEFMYKILEKNENNRKRR